MMKNILLVSITIVVLQTAAGEDTCLIGNGNYHKTNLELDLHKVHLYGPFYSMYVLNNEWLGQYRCWITNYHISGDKIVHSTETYSVSGKKRMLHHGNVTYNGHVMSKEFPTWPEVTTNFSIIAVCPEYKCVILGGCPKATQGKPLAWIDFRNPNPSEDEVKAAAKIAEENGLKFSDFGNGCENKAEFSMK